MEEIQESKERRSRWNR